MKEIAEKFPQNTVWFRCSAGDTKDAVTLAKAGWLRAAFHVQRYIPHRSSRRVYCLMAEQLLKRQI